MVKLGQKVGDKLAGFTGTVFGRTEYLYGCVRVCVLAEELADGKPNEQWFDEDQLEVVKPKPVPGNSGKTTGGPRGASPRRRDARRR